LCIIIVYILYSLCIIIVYILYTLLWVCQVQAQTHNKLYKM
jgi:hypothetical protein